MKKILMSRDVIFYEYLFPFKNVRKNLIGDKVILLNVINDESCPFEVNVQGFIPLEEYNLDQIDFINENE